MSFISTVDRLFHIKHHAAPAPAPKLVKPAAPVDGFDAARPTPVIPNSPVAAAGGVRSTSALMTEASLRSSATAAVGGVVSPYYQGRIGRDGKQFVGPTGEAFNYRGVSEFLLPKYLNDPSRSAEENEKIVGDRMDERVKQGYSVMRVFGAVAWDNAPLKPFENWEAYKQNTEKLFTMAKDRGMYIEFTAFTDTGSTIPNDKRGEYIDFVAQMAKKYDNAFVEICNESFKNGLSDQEVYDLGKRFKQTAPEAMLAGSSATSDGGEEGAVFGKAPFDYLTIHSERSDGDDGFRWVRHMREGESAMAASGKPVVQDEPIGSAGAPQPGRRDNNPQHFRDGALVAAVTGQGFTFHTERAVTADPNAHVDEPGADATQVSDLIPIDNRGTHFVNGHWADSPFDVGNQFDTSVLRVFTKMKDDGSGFWTYPVNIHEDLNLKVKNATHLTVKDVMTGEKIVDRDFAAGENLRLAKGSDVVIYGGNAAQPDVKTVNAIPKVPGADEPVPAQSSIGALRGPRLQTDASVEAMSRVYDAVLGRPIDPEAREGFGKRLFAQGDYGQAVDFLMTEEFNNRRASGLQAGTLGAGMYQKLLGRPATVEELTSAVASINQGRGGEVVKSILLSNEFQLSVGAPAGPDMGSADPLPAQRKTGSMKTAPYAMPAATEIVERLYKGLLGREADKEGMVGWVALVARGGLRDAINGIMGSPEFQGRKDALTVGGVATGLYRAILDRDPDQGGLEGTQSLLRSGLMAERTAAMLMSEEYRQNH